MENKTTVTEWVETGDMLLTVVSLLLAHVEAAARAEEREAIRIRIKSIPLNNYHGYTKREALSIIDSLEA